MSKTLELIGEGAAFVIAGAGPGDETYTHSVWGTFNVSRIRKHLEGRPTVRVDITNPGMTRGADVDQHRVEELLRRADLHAPIILINCEDGTHIMIDGLHRVVAKRRLGYDGTEARIATLTEVKPFMVHIHVTRADGTVVDQRELDKAWLEEDQGRHNGPDGRPRPDSTRQDWVFPNRPRN